MNCNRTLTLLLLCIPLQTFAGEHISENIKNSKADCSAELKAQYLAEIERPILTEEEIAKYAALLPQLQTSELNVPDEVIKQFQELEIKLNVTSAAIAEKYPACTP